MHSFTARLIASPEKSAGGTADARPVRITIRNGHIAAVMPIDVSDSELAMLPFVAPGLFDLQMNGYRGIWFSSDELTVDQVEQVIHDYAAHGVTRCLPTLITNSIEAIEHGLRTIRQAVQKIAFVRDVIVA